MGNVPGTNSCPVADVVTLVPSQAAACDTERSEHKISMKVLKRAKKIQRVRLSFLIELLAKIDKTVI